MHLIVDLDLNIRKSYASIPLNEIMLSLIFVKIILVNLSKWTHFGQQDQYALKNDYLSSMIILVSYPAVNFWRKMLSELHNSKIFTSTFLIMALKEVLITWYTSLTLPNAW